MLGRFKNLGRALSISVLNQVISSGTNFAIIVYLVRSLDKEQFGLYSLGFALTLLVAGLTSSLISTQFVVNLPDQAIDQRRIYAAGHAVALLVLGFGAVGFGALLIWLQIPLQLGAVDLRPLLLPVTVSAGFFALREFFVRVAYSEREETIALLSSISVACAVIVSFGLLAIKQHPIFAQTAIYIYGGGQFFGALVALLLLRLPRHGVSKAGLTTAFRDSWPGGRWNILTNLIYNVRTQVHNLLVGPILGAVALAEVNAARVLVTPAIMMIPPLTQILLPRLAEKRNQGVDRLFRIALMFVGLLAAIASAYSLILLAGLSWIIPLVLGDQYAHVGPLVLAWCVVALLLASRNGLTIALQALRAFRDLMLANLISAIFAVLAAIIMIQLFFAPGAVWALAISELVLCVVLIAMIRSWRRAGPTANNA